MKDLKQYQMELDLIVEQSASYGKMIPELYALNYFIFSKQNKKLPPSIKKQIKVKDTKLNIVLKPQILPDDEAIKYRYLNLTDFDVLNYIIWKSSHQINKLPIVIISLNEMLNILGINKQKIKESLTLLSTHKAQFENESYYGILPNQFFDSFSVKQGQQTQVKLTTHLHQWIINNKHLVMNYKQMFDLNNRISKLLYIRIICSNIAELNTTKPNILKIFNFIRFLDSFGIPTNSKVKKARVKKELMEAFTELREHHIINSIPTIHTTNNDWSFDLVLCSGFSQQTSLSNIIKKNIFSK